jgi:hypothetical protein
MIPNPHHGQADNPLSSAYTMGHDPFWLEALGEQGLARVSIPQQETNGQDLLTGGIR